MHQFVFASISRCRLVFLTSTTVCAVPLDDVLVLNCIAGKLHVTIFILPHTKTQNRLWMHRRLHTHMRQRRRALGRNTQQFPLRKIKQNSSLIRNILLLMFYLYWPSRDDGGGGGVWAIGKAPHWLISKDGCTVVMAFNAKTAVYVRSIYK